MLDYYYKEAYGRLYSNELEELVTFNHTSEFGEVNHLFLKREIPYLIDKVQYYDLITPYGYGGPAVVNCPSQNDRDQLIQGFKKAFDDYCKDNKIVSEFVRFHPLLKNVEDFKEIYETSCSRNTVYMDLTDEASIMTNMKPTSRNKIRKAEKLGITVEENTTKEGLEAFQSLYYMTMEKNNASGYYYFEKKYFDDLLAIEGTKIFNTILEGEIISSIIVLAGEKYLHSHLLATNPKHYKAAPNNVLYRNIALWGHENGYEKMHLGGGYSSAEDSLYQFKKGLNKLGEVEFYIGKRILEKDIYAQLTRRHGVSDDEGFFPAYRCEVKTES